MSLDYEAVLRASWSWATTLLVSWHTSIFGKSLDYSTPLHPLPGDVVGSDGVTLEAWVASKLSTLTQGFCITDDVHATVIAVLLPGRGLL